MYAEAASDLPSRRPMPHFRFFRNAKRLDMEDAKVALDIIVRPSLQLWKLALGRSALTAFKRPQTVMLDNATSRTSCSISPKKRVRFDEQPVTISRRYFFGRRRKNSISSPVRPCLVVRLHDNLPHKPARPSFETDNHSVYEDCLSDHPAYLADLHVPEDDQCSDMPPLRCIRRSEFYETECGIALFDRTGYANYCLSRWLDKQREEVQTSKKPISEVPVAWPNSTLSPPSNATCNETCPVPPLPTPVCRPPRSLSRRIWKHFEDELQNAVVVLIIGSFIHICLFLYLLYDILTRGLIPSDD